MLARLNRSISWQRSIEISQWLIPLASIYFIWTIVDSKTSNSNLIRLLETTFSEINILLFTSVMVVLTFLNVFFESLKWKSVMNEFQPLTYSESILQTLKSMAAGFVTPFRSGAILARFVSNENADKMKIVDATLQMAVAQFTVTYLLGLSGMMYWFHVNDWDILFISAIVLLLFSILVIFYFAKFPLSIHFQKREWRAIRFDPKLILFSFLRYSIFSFQYVLLLRIFGVDVDWILAFSLVSVTFLVNSLLPTGILGKIGVRELSGILIIGESTGFILEVSSAAFIIWILNQAFPALVGSLLFLKRNSVPN